MPRYTDQEAIAYVAAKKSMSVAAAGAMFAGLSPRELVAVMHQIKSIMASEGHKPLSYKPSVKELADYAFQCQQELEGLVDYPELYKVHTEVQALKYCDCADGRHLYRTWRGLGTSLAYEACVAYCRAHRGLVIDERRYAEERAAADREADEILRLQAWAMAGYPTARRVWVEKERRYVDVPVPERHADARLVWTAEGRYAVVRDSSGQ